MNLIIFSDYYYFDISKDILNQVKTIVKNNCILYFGIPVKSIISSFADITSVFLCKKESLELIDLEEIIAENYCEDKQPIILNIEKFSDIFHHSEFKNTITNDCEPIIFVKNNEWVEEFDFSYVKDHPNQTHKKILFDETSVEDIPLLNIFQYNS